MVGRVWERMGEGCQWGSRREDGSFTSRQGPSSPWVDPTHHLGGQPPEPGPGLPASLVSSWGAGQVPQNGGAAQNIWPGSQAHLSRCLTHPPPDPPPQARPSEGSRQR